MAILSYSDAPVTPTRNLVPRKVVRVSSVGKKRMYDIEVSNPKHNFLLPSGIITSNSHAVCYSVIGYACSFLKHHYPLEWWTSVLRNADKNEVNETFWHFCGHLIDLPDINLSQDRFCISGDRIRAPLSLILGVGDAAHKLLCAGRPYKDLWDFCQKIENYKKSVVTQVLDDAGNPVMVTNKKTGVTTPKTKAGHCPLNNPLVCTLIICGVMDSLFPQDMATTDKLDLYQKTMAEVSGKKPEKVPEKFTNVNSFVRYQVRKSVLPVYAEDLMPMLAADSNPAFIPDTDRPQWMLTDSKGELNSIPFVTLSEVTVADQTRPWPMYHDGLKVAAAAYIVDERHFGYKGNRAACEYTFDISGGRLHAVKWPAQGQEKLSAEYRADRKGSIAVVVLEKRKEDRPFSVISIDIIRPPLGSASDQE